MDNSAANRIAELDEAIATISGKSNTSDQTYEEDRIYLNKITSFEGKDFIRLYYHPWGLYEGERTKNEQKREAVLKEYQKRYQTEYHSTTFPILMSDENPATFVTEEQSRVIDDILNGLPKKLRKDLKMISDALFNPKIKFQYILTCDREHLATPELQEKLETKGFNLRICTPKQLFTDLAVSTFPKIPKLSFFPLFCPWRSTKFLPWASALAKPA